MSAGWGKKAATRIDRTQFDNDELLKSLGTQFNVDFSKYDQWQRTVSGNKDSRIKSTGKASVNADKSTRFTIGRVKTPESESTGTNHVSFVERRQAARKEELDKEIAEKTQILELRIKTRRKTNSEYEKRYRELLQENWKLKNIIGFTEGTVHDDVKLLLRKYERYTGGISKLNNKFAKESEESSTELEILKKQIETNTAVLNNALRIMSDKLDAKQNELKVLLSYKDKEYPVKAIQIGGLQTEKDNMKMTNQEESEELERIVNTELGKYEKNQTQTLKSIRRNVSEKAVDMMHQSLKDMASQNNTMEKEIQLHRCQKERLQQKCLQVEEEVKFLIANKPTNVRFPRIHDFVVNGNKCMPDMDVVLDIPTQQCLPI